MTSCSIILISLNDIRKSKETLNSAPDLTGTEFNFIKKIYLTVTFEVKVSRPSDSTIIR